MRSELEKCSFPAVVIAQEEIHDKIIEINIVLGAHKTTVKGAAREASLI